MTKPITQNDADLATIREVDRIVWSIARGYKIELGNMRSAFMDLHSLKADLFLAENYPEHEQDTSVSNHEVEELRAKVTFASQDYEAAVAQAASTARALKAKLVPSN